MSEVIIRKSEAKDVEQVMDVFYKTWLATYPNKEVGITEEDVHERYKNSFTEEEFSKRRKYYDTEHQNESFLVAEIGDKVVGVCFSIIREECNQLQAIYVLPEYQGKGIGKMFWEDMVKFFDKDKKIIVQVATYNTGAIEFYKKLGFTDNGNRLSEESYRMPISKVIIPAMELEIVR